ncbi:M14 family zinc carboxypeptidase [Salinimicrobium oceani]|uniref:Peptidase M14 n=1 Tax=Salinimicrobium oceani TaxID=2722702 RepID=A0ABX1D264_9FLAO|nr:M14 family zinc carboxypeptidase [Salinimicrobium oceani]NJW53263.1 peptidase M14 [Salinimicrobium oceani]
MFTDVTLRLFTFVNMNLADIFLDNYSRFRVDEITGRFLSFQHLDPILNQLAPHFKVAEVGRSFLNVPIKSIQVGSGPIKILAWSQMHGNETTTTKGVLDLLQFFAEIKEEADGAELLTKFSLLLIPMLNPDGAARYTRENVNKIDLNRDAQLLREPESKVLRACFENFRPDYCLNLHDQRTIFGVDGKPATLSFLAPSMDESRTVNDVREKAMSVIVGMNRALQGKIPGQVGRFDDSYNINCTGDYFQTLKVPTILFECGHFSKDYQREKTRELFAYSLLVGLEEIVSGRKNAKVKDEYFSIPENQKNFYDIILRNGVVAGEKVDVAVQYTEIMKAGEINFVPKVQTMAPNLSSFGHEEINCHGGVLKNVTGGELSENDIVEVILLNKEKLSIKTP